MKKTLFLLLTMCGASITTAIASGSGSTPSPASSVFGSNGSLTVKYEWESTPAALTDTSVAFGDSNGTTTTVAVAAMNGYLLCLINGNPDFSTYIPYQHQGGVPYYFDINNYNKDNATFVYTEGTGSPIYNLDITGRRPQSVDKMTINQGGATVTLGSDKDVELTSLTALGDGTLVTPKNLSISGLTKQNNNYIANKVNNLVVNGTLILGKADSASTLQASGTLSVAGGITLGNINSSASAAALLGNTLNITVADSELQKLTGGSTTVLALGTTFEGTTTLNGEEGDYICGGKLVYTLIWETPLSRENAAAVLNLYAKPNADYVTNALAPTAHSYNGRAGVALISNAFITADPQQTAPTGAQAGLLNTVDAGTMTDEALSAAAGASLTVLGQALNGDVERQLRAIRNRAAMGYYNSDSKTTNAKGYSTSSPNRYFAWANAEGNRAEQNADSTAPGYTLTNWGATVGAGMQVNNRLSLGLALTAMYGDLKSDGSDTLEGDMDTAYLSAFADYRKRAWSHSLIGTAGTMQVDYHRTVSHATGSYSTNGDTDGIALGLMYELSRNFALSRKSTLSPIFNISYRHTTVDDYSESGADAALNVAKQSQDTVTLGLGARYTAQVGQQTLNRTCNFEARALAKYDLGDRQSSTDVGFVGQSFRADIESAELGAFGVELGAGIAIPAGRGSIFADGSVELRNDYTNYNATVGYKVQF